MILVSENGMQMEKNTKRSLTFIYYCTITGLNEEIKSHFADKSADLYLKKIITKLESAVLIQITDFTYW